MRTSLSIYLTLLAASAHPVFGAPVVLSNRGQSHDSQLVARVKLPASLYVAGETIGNALSGLLGPTIGKAYIALHGIDAEMMKALVAKIQMRDIGTVSDDFIRAVYRSNKHDADVFRILQDARQEAIESVSGGYGLTREFGLLRALGKDGDKAAVDAIKMAAPTPGEIKRLGLGGLLNPSKVSAKKTAAAAAVALTGGVVAVAVLTAAGVTLSQVDLSTADEYAAASNGAIPETDQRQLLAAIDQQPEHYPTIMQKVREYKGITSAEIALFESADPAKKNVQRSLIDLD